MGSKITEVDMIIPVACQWHIESVLPLVAVFYDHHYILKGYIDHKIEY